MGEDEGPAFRILRDAIDMELEGKEFFEHASKAMSNRRAKDMFISLAKQEQRHVDVLRHELDRLGQGLQWASLASAKDAPSPRTKKTVFGDRKVRRLGPRADAGELEVIDFGIAVEERSIEYYREAGHAVEDPNARQVFNWLVGEEAGHLTILRAERDSRSGSGFHYDEMEFSLEVQ